MKTLMILMAAVLILGGCSSKKKDDSLTKTETVTVKLPSMVCSTCAETIQKAAYRVEGVKDVEVDVDKKEAEIKFVSYQTNLETIETAITEAGYDANGKKRNPDAYSKLDKCCKIDG